MKAVFSINEMQQLVTEIRAIGQSVGFIPTMGALHEGHLTLLRNAVAENNFTVVSIFVNPTQFNNSNDLEKYPRTLETDMLLLEKEGCDFVFVPTVEEMYPHEIKSEPWDFGLLSKVMEGKNRPGHFDGVATVVKRLFEAIPANRAYFGKKDFQQLLVIQAMVQQLNLKIEIIPIDIVREKDGLAMSSRNARLTFIQRQNVTILYKTLKKSKELARHIQLDELKTIVKQEIESVDGLTLEYFEVANAITLEPLTILNESVPTMAFIVVLVDQIRLIDNIQIF